MPDLSTVGPSRRREQWRRLFTGLGALVFLGFVTIASISESDFGSTELALYEREPSSTVNGKAQVLAATQGNPLKFTRKLQGPLTARIDGTVGAPGDTVTLTGHIESSAPIGKARVRWQVPEHLEVVAGATNNTLYDLKPGEPQLLELTVRILSEGNHQVHLRATSLDKGRRFSHVAQFNTRDQQIIDFEKSELAKRSSKDLQLDHDHSHDPTSKSKPDGTKPLKVFR